MPTIKLQNGNVLLKEGKAACSCCVDPTAPAFAAMPFALCGYSWWSEFECAFTEFTAEESGEPEDPDYQPEIVASCPPKFYATKTVHIFFEYSSTTDTQCPRPDTKEVMLESTQTYAFNSATPCVPVCIGAEGTSTETNTTYFCQETGDPDIDTCTSSLVACDDWLGEIKLAIDDEPFEIFRSCAQFTLDNLGAGPFEADHTGSTTSRSGIFSGGGTYENGGWEWSYTITETLSDELSDGRAHETCDVVFCNSGDVPATPGCKSTCTDRGSGEPGMAINYSGIEGDSSNGGPCYVYRSGSLGWEREPTCTPRNTTGEWAKQDVDVWWWAKNLTVGNYYKARFEFKRCCYDDALDDEDTNDYQKCGEPLYPCNVDGEDNIIYTTPTAIEIVFQAEAWAEIITPFVTIPEVRYKKCQLEDEAAAWNAANPGETPRTVVEGGSPVAVPQTYPCYTWLEATSFEAL